MAAKTANLYARIEPDLKDQAESILQQLGISASSAINIFYKQIILQNGLPFDVKLPVSKPISIDLLSKEELDNEIEKGYKDMIDGDVNDVDHFFSSIHKDYNI